MFTKMLKNVLRKTKRALNIGSKRKTRKNKTKSKRTKGG